MKKLMTGIALLVIAGNAAAVVLISDDFNSADDASINTGIARQTGTLAGTAYLIGEATAGDVGLVSGQVSYSDSGAGEPSFGLDHNFVDSSITTAGGFTLTYDTNPSGDQWLGGSIGLSATEMGSTTRRFDTAAADISWFVRDSRIRVNDGAVDVLNDATYVGDGAYSVEIRVETTSFASGASALFFMKVDGVDIDLGGPGGGHAFTWNANNENYIHFGGIVGGTFDNLLIETLPGGAEAEPGSFFIVR